MAYIAPEIFQGDPASPASDLYAIGLMAYELLTGSFPFSSDSISTNLGMIANARFDFESALTYFKACVDYHQVRSEWLHTARAMNNVATTLTFLGDLAEARVYGEEGLRIRREIRDQDGIGNSLIMLANAILLEGDHALARDHYEQCLAAFEMVGNIFGMGNALVGLGRVANQAGDYTTAQTHLNRSLALFQQHNIGAGMAACRMEMSYAKVQTQQADASMSLIEAIEIAQAKNIMDMQLMGILIAAQYLINEGKLQTAGVWVGTIQTQVLRSDVRQRLNGIQAQLKKLFAPELLDLLEKKGAALTLEQVVEQVLATLKQV